MSQPEYTLDSSPPTEQPGRLRRRWKWLAVIAAALLAVAVTRNYWLGTLLNHVALRHLENRNPEGALPWLRVSKALASGDPHTPFLLARTLRKLERFEEVPRHLERARQLGWPQDRVDREQVLASAQAGDLPAAMPQMETLLSNPLGESAEIYEAYATGLINARIFKPAYDLLNLWSAEEPQNPEPRYLLARISLECNDWPRAEEYLRKALEADPQHIGSIFATGELLLTRQRPDEALQYFQYAQRDDGKRAAALAQQGRCLRQLGRTEEAREALEHALGDDPRLSGAHLEMARLELEADESQAALDRLTAAVDSDPHNYDLRFERATALERCGDTDAARREFQAAAEGREQLGRALHLQRQLLVDAGNVAARCEIGRIQLEYGDPREAVQWLQSVLLFQPDHREARELLVKAGTR